jgi:hypothetical protein
MRNVATDGRSITNLRVANKRCRSGQCGQRARDRRVGDNINGTRHGTNSQLIADNVDACQTRYTVEIDQHLRPSQAQIHEGDQTLPTG